MFHNEIICSCFHLQLQHNVQGIAYFLESVTAATEENPALRFCFSQSDEALQNNVISKDSQMILLS